MARSAASAGAAAPAARAVPAVAPESAFGRLVARLSEPGGYFDSDNLISNETSYLHVLDAMRRLRVHGGAYVGVGPDQNFTYIAAVRPSIAYIFDIRRDNLLEHLLFKALFAEAGTRVEYLALLFGRPAPADAAAWTGRSIAELVAYIDRTPADGTRAAATRRDLIARAGRFGVALTAPELETIGRIRDAFVRDSLGIRFSSTGRAPRPYHPTYRQLLLERDRSGAQRNFLASEESYRVVRDLEARDRVVPVVGDAAGDRALAAIAADIARRGERVSVLYMSNVEQYLFRGNALARFADNVRRLPRDSRSVIIHSYFGRGFDADGAHPLHVPGHYSTQILQMLDAFVAAFDSGTVRSYRDLVSRNYVAP